MKMAILVQTPGYEAAHKDDDELLSDRRRLGDSTTPPTWSPEHRARLWATRSPEHSAACISLDVKFASVMF